MDLTTFCNELKQRIPGSIEVAMYDLNKVEIATSNEQQTNDNLKYLKEEEIYDNVSKFGRGKHSCSTIVMDDKTIMILTCGKIKVFISLRPLSNIGLIYSLLPSIQSSLSTIEI
ncbi:hypothetical protein EDI_269680 [Entamoeba dispar SAW760]|uniref:Roadblock/LAMTOR2 domain-containing protein n=1 Tax=Entamoeba dispar (strain ATCC PRA-260 / SAW760) TaxID=370354 RepID=B0ERP5_ENTDS|nr:uncharacterized protein EDI_269660 [Entamoeba dispar SAW760]XP_001740771.1 uncharacterized protein EDI_269680 [Entamoeba dispar SAW760]EDR22808.1 hypothetical protein EDI_269660 [Entamoeba dispar SAW760]EDR22810.1 hypothetical protein EDI_269680 [Entamoeba dispar SAW760]|eukprot:EDR22808.1 hypothetical protein EDI_269660 [Entamoeba dispar SAW760]